MRARVRVASTDRGGNEHQLRKGPCQMTERSGCLSKLERPNWLHCASHGPTQEDGQGWQNACLWAGTALALPSPRYATQPMATTWTNQFSQPAIEGKVAQPRGQVNTDCPTSRTQSTSSPAPRTKSHKTRKASSLSLCWDKAQKRPGGHTRQVPVCPCVLNRHQTLMHGE